MGKKEACELKSKVLLDVSRFVIADKDTGETHPLDVFFEIVNDDSNEDEKIGREDFATPREEEWSGLFARVYLQAFCAAADSMIQSQKLRIFLYLLANTNPGTNTVRASYDDINRACGTSAKTVSKLLKGAQAAGILKRIKGSEYMINPKYMCYGRDGKVMWLNKCYNSDDTAAALAAVQEKFSASRKKASKKKQ